MIDSKKKKLWGVQKKKHVADIHLIFNYDRYAATFLWLTSFVFNIVNLLLFLLYKNVKNCGIYSGYEEKVFYIKKCIVFLSGNILKNSHSIF